jgi:F-type H+-transporting ATPase subunit a
VADIVHIEVAGIDLSINRVVLQMFVVVLLVWGLFYLGFRRPKLVPSGLQNVMESIVDFIRNQIVLEVIGRDGLRFLPYLTTLFVFVFFGNLGGVIPPVFFPLNGRMALPAVMAICSLLLFISVGISTQGPRLLQERPVPPGHPVAGLRPADPDRVRLHLHRPAGHPGHPVAGQHDRPAT